MKQEQTFIVSDRVTFPQKSNNEYLFTDGSFQVVCRKFLSFAVSHFNTISLLDWKDHKIASYEFRNSQVYLKMTERANFVIAPSK